MRGSVDANLRLATSGDAWTYGYGELDGDGYSGTEDGDGWGDSDEGTANGNGYGNGIGDN